MSEKVVRVGIVGRGFGAKVVAPTFEATEGCEVVEVVSPRDEAAVSSLCARADVDLISVHSPPFMHLDNVRRAIDGGHAVLCDKPFGRNADDAVEMCDLASDAGVVNLLNFEMRFDPERQRLRELVQSGAVGEPQHFHDSMFLSTGGPARAYGWQFDRELGGGWLRSLGSHEIDFIRWTYGEIVEGAAILRTTITERPDAEGQARKCTADDGFTATLRSETGVTAVIDSSFAAPVNLPPRMVVIGSSGVAELTADHRITLQTSDGGRELLELDRGERNPLTLSMRRWAAVIRDAVRRGEVEPGSPTFADGLACVQVMDRLRS